jgi:hypothetical protein
MSRNATPLNQEAIAEAIEAMRLQIADLNQRIERQEKRAQKIQVTSATGSRRSEPGPAAEAQAVLAEMVKKRDAMQAELEALEAGQSSRTE